MMHSGRAMWSVQAETAATKAEGVVAPSVAPGAIRVSPTSVQCRHVSSEPDFAGARLWQGGSVGPLLGIVMQLARHCELAKASAMAIPAAINARFAARLI